MKPGDLVVLESNCWFCEEPGVMARDRSEVIMHPKNEVGIILESRELEDDVINAQWYRLLIPSRGLGWVNHCVLGLLNET